MAEIDLNIGGKLFRVACADGEERQLQSAAALVASEAQNLVAAIGQLPESRMLLMSSLMLGDRHIALQGQLRAAEDRIRALEQSAERTASASPAPAQPTVSPSNSAEAIAALTRTAETLEAMADALESQPA